MGGIGKTELAIQYCRKNFNLNKNKIPLLQPLSEGLNWIINQIFNNYRGGIYWINAREQNISSQIIYFAYKELNLQPPEKLELIDQVDWIWKHWRRGKTLVVLDDVKNYSDIKPYLPPEQSQFKVLITTRLNLGISNPLNLKVLSEKEALNLLVQLINSKKVQQELETAKKLCQRLGYLPLALQLVGRYIKKRRITLAEELRRLEAKGLTHPSTKIPKNDPTWTSNIKHGVAAAFELSWEELTKSTQELGCLLSLFAVAPIPWSLIENITTQKQKSLIIKNQEELEKARSELENFHLLQSKENNYQLHQLIQEFLRDKQRKLTIRDIQKSQLCTTIANITKKISETATLSDINHFTIFIPHISEIINLYQDQLSDEDLIWPFIGLGRFYKSQGDYTQALPWYEKCSLATKKRFGEEHPTVATSLGNLAELYRAQGKYEEAEPLYLQALEIDKKKLGEENLETIISFNNLALLYHNQKRYEEAEPLYLKALKLYKKLLGEEHTLVATSLNNLAGLYHQQGRYEEAEPLYLEALELRKKILGEEHSLIATSLNNLASLYNDQGRYENDQERYEEAEPLYLEALEIYKNLLGEEHPLVAISLNNLAGLCKNQGRYKEAKDLYIQALEIAEKNTRKRSPQNNYH